MMGPLDFKALEILGAQLCLLEHNLGIQFWDRHNERDNCSVTESILGQEFRNY